MSTVVTSSRRALPADEFDAQVAAVMLRAIDRGREQSRMNAGGVASAWFGEFAEESLRAARNRFIERLQARSDDFDATYGLRALEAASRAKETC